MNGNLSGIQNCAIEWAFITTRSCDDPFHDVELDVLISASDGREWRVPAFWAGGNEWRVRFAPPDTVYSRDTVLVMARVA